MPDVSATLLAHAQDCLDGAGPASPDIDIDAAWDEGPTGIAIAATLGGPMSPASRAAWLALAKRTVGASLAAAHATARIESLEKSQRLQHALYEIADLAGSGLEMHEMLRRIHGVVGGLMYAGNFFIVVYDDVRESVRFLYFADALDPYVAQPDVAISTEQMPNSLTVALLHCGADAVTPRTNAIYPYRITGGGPELGPGRPRRSAGR